MRLARVSSKSKLQQVKVVQAPLTRGSACHIFYNEGTYKERVLKSTFGLPIERDWMVVPMDFPRMHESLLARGDFARERAFIGSEGEPRIECGNQGGFTLLEVVCVLAIVAMLAAILLPRAPVATSQSRLEAYAVEVAALLKADRNAALTRGAVVAAAIDARGRQISSGSSRRVVRIPDDVLMDALLPEFCNGRPALSTVTFFATGMSCGGAIRLTRFRSGFDVRVNWLTGGIDIVARQLE